MKVKWVVLVLILIPLESRIIKVFAKRLPNIIFHWKFPNTLNIWIYKYISSYQLPPPPVKSEMKAKISDKELASFWKYTHPKFRWNIVDILGCSVGYILTRSMEVKTTKRHYSSDKSITNSSSFSSYFIAVISVFKKLHLQYTNSTDKIAEFIKSINSDQ